MAIRSTDIGVRQPTAPKFFQPNFDLLLQDIATQQAAFDQFNDELSSAQIQALDSDQDRRGQLLNEFEQRKELVADEFMKKGRLAGNRLLNKQLRGFRKQFLPGGEAFEINENFKRHAAFTKDVNDLVRAGKITGDVAQSALAFNKNRFVGTQFDPNTGSFNTFQGDPVSETINVYDTVDKRIKGYIPDMHERGSSYIGKDGYIHYQNKQKEWVKSDVVAEDLKGALLNDPELSSFFGQNIKFGIDTPESVSNVLNDAINYGASKAGFLRESSTDRITGESSALKSRRTRDKIDYKNQQAEGTTAVYKIDSGATGFNKNDFVKSFGNAKEVRGGMTGPTNVKGANETQRFDVNAVFSQPNSQEAQDFIAKNGMEKFSTYKLVYDSFGRDTVDIKDLEKRTENFQAEMNRANIPFTKYRGDRQKQRNESVSGPNGNNQVGDISTRQMMRIEGNKAVGNPITYQDLLDETGLSVEELKDRLNIIGEMRGDNLAHPSGEIANFTSKDGKGYWGDSAIDQILILDNSAQESQQNAPLWLLNQPRYNAHMKHSPQVQMGNFRLRSERVDVFDDNNNYRREMRYYATTPDGVEEQISESDLKRFRKASEVHVTDEPKEK